MTHNRHTPGRCWKKDIPAAQRRCKYVASPGKFRAFLADDDDDDDGDDDDVVVVVLLFVVVVTGMGTRMPSRLSLRLMTGVVSCTGAAMFVMPTWSRTTSNCCC